MRIRHRQKRRAKQIAPRDHRVMAARHAAVRRQTLYHAVRLIQWIWIRRAALNGASDGDYIFMANQ